MVENRTTIPIAVRAFELAPEGAPSAPQPPVVSLAELRSERDRLMRIAGAAEVLPTLLHEIRNPLAAIHSMVELLIEDSEDLRVRGDLSTVLGEVRRIQTLLSGIGSMGRNLRALRPHAVDHAIEECTHLLVPMASERGIELTADVQTMPLLPFDVASLRGVLFNLIRNSIEACRPGDRIEVVARLRQDRDALQIDVRDTGAGMSPETLARCTELFFSTKPNGTGIGLGVVRESVEAAGGTVQVASRLGEGTTIRLKLPLQFPAEAPVGSSTNPAR